MGNIGHSTIGPSAADRWMVCTGSVALSAQCPKQRTSKAAAEGTVAHTLAEALVTKRQDEMDLMARIGEVVNVEGHEIEITEEMVEGARLYRDTIEADYSELNARPKPKPIERHCEQRVDVKSVDPDLWGSLDYSMYRVGDTLIVYDYKYGKGKYVSPDRNRQAGLYVLGVLETLVKGHAESFDRLEIVIVQPRAGGVKRWAVEKAWLAVLRNNAAVAIQQARAPGAPLVPGDHCRWCPAQAYCPAIAGQLSKEAEIDFAALAPETAETAVSEVPSERRGLPDFRLLTLAQCAQVLDWEDALEAFVGACRQRVHDALVAGKEVSGYKLVDGRSNRKWADESGERAASYFAPKFGHRVYAPKKALSVAQMEKLVGKPSFAAIEAELVTRPEAAKKVARADDPRPLASTTADEDFDPLNQGPKGVVAVSAGFDPLLPAPAPEAAPLEDPLAVPAGRWPIWP